MNELKELSIEELNDKVLSFSRVLFNLRMQVGMGSAQVKTDQFSKIKRQIAQVKTELSYRGKQHAE